MWSWCSRDRTRVFRTERQRYSTNFVFNAQCIWYSLPDSYMCTCSKLPDTPSLLFLFWVLGYAHAQLRSLYPLSTPWCCSHEKKIPDSLRLQFCVLEQRSLRMTLLYVYIVASIVCIKVLKYSTATKFACTIKATLLTWHRQKYPWCCSREKSTMLSLHAQLQFCVLEQRSLGTRLIYMYFVLCIVKVLKYRTATQFVCAFKTTLLTRQGKKYLWWVCTHINGVCRKEQTLSHSS